MRGLVLIVALAAAPAYAEPAFYAFAGGAFIQGPEASTPMTNVIGEANAMRAA
jgi:hypothetical protein